MKIILLTILLLFIVIGCAKTIKSKKTNNTMTQNQQSAVTTITKEKAVWLAENYIRDQGYTNSSMQFHHQKLVRESLDNIDEEKTRENRHNTLKPKAVGLSETSIQPNIGKPQTIYTVGFEYSDAVIKQYNHNTNNGRAVIINTEGFYYEISIAHQDLFLDRLKPLPKKAYKDAFFTEQNFDKIVNLVMKKGNHTKNGTFFYQISNIAIMLINPCYEVSQTGKHPCEKEIMLHLKDAYNDKDWYEFDVDHIAVTKRQKNNFTIWAENVNFDDSSQKWIDIKSRQKGRDYSKPHILAEPWFKAILEQTNSIILDALPFEKPNAKKHSIEVNHTEKAKFAIYKYLKNHHLKLEDNPLTEEEIENIQKIYFNWGKFNVQYFGVIENEKPIVFANFYPKEDDDNLDFRANQKVTFDGGFWYWQVAYDLETDTIINLTYNGES